MQIDLPPHAKRMKKTYGSNSHHEMELIDTKMNIFYGWNHRQWWISFSMPECGNPFFILSQKRGYLVEWKAKKTTKLKAHNIITNDEIKKKIKIKYWRKNPSQLEFTIPTRHLRHEIGIKKSFFKKINIEKKRSKLNK